MSYKALCVAVMVLGMAGCSWNSSSKGMSTSESEISEILQEDQKRIDEAQENYRVAIVKYGDNSDEAKKALDELSAARNQYHIDVKRAQEARSVQFSTTTPTGLAN
jgi:hypothetical protein